MPARNQSKVLSEEEMERLYPNEWILLEVTRVTRDRRARGRVLFHSPIRSELSEPVIQFHEEHPDAETGVIFAGPLVDPDFDGSIVL